MRGGGGEAVFNVFVAIVIWTFLRLANRERERESARGGAISRCCWQQGKTMNTGSSIESRSGELQVSLMRLAVIFNCGDRPEVLCRLVRVAAYVPKQLLSQLVVKASSDIMEGEFCLCFVSSATLVLRWKFQVLQFALMAAGCLCCHWSSFFDWFKTAMR